uniref:Carboxylic ester hydrolase n=1 Tax=Meloidogyne incognita TaxID=6306 RepID=A0A914KX18_MELIC
MMDYSIEDRKRIKSLKTNNGFCLSLRHLLYFPFVFLSQYVVSAAVYVNLSDGSPIFGSFVQAATGKYISQFLGVPFAEPPIGKLRFRRPIPKRPWREQWNATTFRDSCVQSPDTYFGDFYGATMWNSNTPCSEDCLYLNIYVPGEIDREKRLPVLFWIYGGGFWSGTASLDVYDGKIFAGEENVIIVTVNYRVTVFGFLYLGREEAPGNMGLWDQLLALKWVYKNIQAFGGDPSLITLFGESAGGASVSMHMLSPLSQPYFTRSILQSGAATAPWAVENKQVALHRAVILYEYMKCGNGNMSHLAPDQWNMDEVLRCLHAASADKLRDSEWSPVMEFADFPWVPVIDGEFLVENIETSLKRGNFKKTQLLAGSNLFHCLSISGTDVFPPAEFFEKKDFIKSRDVWIKSVSSLLPRQILKSSLALQSILNYYEPEGLPIESKQWVDSLDKMLGDFLFTCNVNEFALAHSEHGADTYYYMFSHRASQQTWPEWMGVLHGYEINFIFGEPYNRKQFKYTKEEQELSSRFMRFWANFARTGDPNHNPDNSYISDWPPYNSKTMEYINLTIESDYIQKGAKRIGTGPRRKHCNFWKFIPKLISISADLGESFIKWKQQMDRWENDYMPEWEAGKFTI